MWINLKFEATIIQVQMITYVIYWCGHACDVSWGVGVGKHNGNINIYFSSHSRQVNVATWSLVLPIDNENPYREGDMSSSWHHILACISKFTGWTIIKELSIRRRLRTFLISWGQKTHAKHSYVDLSLWYEFWVAIICISINIISDLSTTIRDDFDSLLVNGSTRDNFS